MAILSALILIKTNMAAHWVKVQNGYIYCFAVCPNGSEGTYIFAGTYGEGIFLSTDGGTVWSSANNGLLNYNVRALAVSSTNLFAGTDNGVFVSSDKGASWNSASNGITDTYIHALSVDSDGTGAIRIFAGTDNEGVFVSTDNGNNWTQVISGLTYHRIWSLALNHNRMGGTDLFAGTEYGGLYLSTNYGESWIEANAGLSGLSVMALAVSDTNIFAGIAGSGVFLSTNRGTNWIEVNNGLTNSSVRTLTVTGAYIFAGTYPGSIFVSSDCGTNWQPINAGLATEDINSFTINSPFGGPDTNLFAGGYGIWRRPLSEAINPFELGTPTAFQGTDISATGFVAHWSSVDDATSYQLDVATDTGFALYVSSYKNKVTSNVTSYMVNRGLLPNTSYYYRVRAVGEEGASSKNSNIIMISTKDTVTFDIFPLVKNLRRVFTYEHKFYEWHPSLLTRTEIDSGIVEYLILDSARSGDTAIIWTIQQSEHLFHRKFGNENYGENSYDTSYYQDTTTVVMLYEDLRGLHELRCNSLVWTFQPTWLYGDRVYRLWIDSLRTTFRTDYIRASQSLYFAHTRGLYKCDFDDVSTGINRYDTWIDALLLDSLSDVVPMALSSDVQEFRLFQNYPNPQNPFSTISFELPKASYVTLNVYNTLGQQVASLLNEQKQPGRYEIQFDGSNLPSGVYFYRLQVGLYSEMKKLLLLR